MQVAWSDARAPYRLVSLQRAVAYAAALRVKASRRRRPRQRSFVSSRPARELRPSVAQRLPAASALGPAVLSEARPDRPAAPRGGDAAASQHPVKPACAWTRVSSPYPPWSWQACVGAASARAGSRHSSDKCSGALPMKGVTACRDRFIRCAGTRGTTPRRPRGCASGARHPCGHGITRSRASSCHQGTASSRRNSNSRRT